MTTYPTAAIREALLRAGCSLAMTDAAMVHLGTMDVAPAFTADEIEAAGIRANLTGTQLHNVEAALLAAKPLPTWTQEDDAADAEELRQRLAAKPEAKMGELLPGGLASGWYDWGGQGPCELCRRGRPGSDGAVYEFRKHDDATKQTYVCHCCAERMGAFNPAPAASPPACRPWCGEGVNRPPRPETHYVRDGRRWCHDGRINHDRDRDRAKAVPRGHTADCGMDLDHKAPCAPSNATGHAVPPVGQPGVPAGHRLAPGWENWPACPGHGCNGGCATRGESTYRRVIGSARYLYCESCAKEAGAIVPVEPSRPGTGEARFYVCNGTGCPCRTGKPASRETMYCNTCGGRCDGPCEEGDEQWEAGQPGKPDEAPLSEEMRDFNDGSRRFADRVAALEAKLAEAMSDIEGWKRQNALLRDVGNEALATRTAEVESLRAAATAQVARIAELERDREVLNCAPAPTKGG